MAYKYDIFVSYRNIYPYNEWVKDHLLPFLNSYLENNLGRQPQVFFDRNEISLGDAWPERLKNALVYSRCPCNLESIILSIYLVFIRISSYAS